MNNEHTVSVDSLRRELDENMFSFESTAELDSLDELVGQERADEAIHFGADIESPGYNIFALGPRGTGKKRTIQEFLEQKAADRNVPEDLVYVNNFEHTDRPNSLHLPPGLGHELKEDMDQFVNQLQTNIPESFNTDEYQQQRERIQSEYEKKRKELLQELDEKAREEDFTVLQTPGGHVLAPIVDGEVMSPDQFSKLDDEKREDIESSREDLQEIHQDIMNQINELQKETRQSIKELDRKTIQQVVEGLIDELKEKYEDHENVRTFLNKVMEDLVSNVPAFRRLRQSEDQQQPQHPLLQQQQSGPNFDKYRVNLIVDHQDSEGAPVVYESNPTYYNLVGKIEHEGQMGELHTDFTMIKSGALHRANGGYLIVEAKDVLTKPFAWESLKRALKNGEIKTESMGQEYRAIQTRSLEPETIPLDVKVVLLGNPKIYYLLCNVDEDFSELFKVKADFGEQADFSEETAEKYARFVGTICENEDLNHFDPSGTKKIIEESIRSVSDQEKISTKFSNIADLVRQSNFWANRNDHQTVQEDDVKKAIDKQMYRANRIEERVQDLIDDGTILIDTEGETVGQVNGLSVLPLGDYMFGKPSRITARTSAGQEGVMNIDREADLGGKIHNKGVMILSGYLQGEFSEHDPIALTASITFEQTYTEVDGDSASSTELYALLSSLSEYPIRQDLAVTGSINQRGEIQSIGGVNKKIEGFYHVCKKNGLTGDQGVMIPSSNVKNLMLRDNVIEAVENEKFHIFAIDHVDEGIELLTGQPAGKKRDDGTYPEGTVKQAVSSRLEELTDAVRKFSKPYQEEE